MPSFVNRARRYVLTTSYKVMYSTLTRQPSLEELPPRSLYVFRLWIDRGLRHYMLVRDPYTRLLSFYFNKVVNPRRRITPDRKWERCQRVLFPYLGLRGAQDPVLIDARLRATSLAELVGLLDRVARLDDHLLPQIESRYRRLRGSALRVRLPVHRFVKMETELDWVRNVLGLDLAIRENPSDPTTDAAELTPELRAIVNRVYEHDFREFGYEMR